MSLNSRRGRDRIIRRQRRSLETEEERELRRSLDRQRHRETQRSLETGQENLQDDTDRSALSWPLEV